jgi:alpha-L-fucosidase 2
MLPWVIMLVPLLADSQDAAMFSPVPAAIDNRAFHPSTLLRYEAPAEAWEEALPVGNGRLGAMVFGRYGEERI